MASITIRRLDDDLKSRLRVQAASHGRSMENEVREILRVALGGTSRPKRNLADAIRSYVAPFDGVELSVAPREPVRRPLKLGK